MGFMETIQQWISNGTIPTVGTVLFGILTIALEVAKHKLIKKLSASESNNAELAKKIVELEEQNAKQNTLNENNNAMLSSLIDMVHVAYASSKLDIATKIQLQKIYDNCPEAIAEAISLIQTLEQVPTKEQVAKVESTAQESYADAIAKKFAE